MGDEEKEPPLKVIYAKKNVRVKDVMSGHKRCSYYKWMPMVILKDWSGDDAEKMSLLKAIFSEKRW